MLAFEDPSDLCDQPEVLERRLLGRRVDAQPSRTRRLVALPPHEHRLVESDPLAPELLQSLIRRDSARLRARPRRRRPATSVRARKPVTRGSDRCRASCRSSAYARLMQRDLRRQAVQLLSDERFERLVHELLVLERAGNDVTLRKLRKPDYGADSLVLKRAGLVEEVIQAKRFTEAPHWPQCEESIDRAVNAWRPPRVTFVFALDFTGNHQKAFDTRIAGRHPEIEVEGLTLTDVERLLDTHPQVGPRFLGSVARDLEDAAERAIRLGGARLETGQDLLARSEEVGRSGDELDPHFVYHQSSGPIEVPRSRFEQLPYLSLEVLNERTRVEVSAWAREESDVSLPWISFSDDEDGREALRLAREGLARGDAVTLTSGFRLSFPQAPVLIKEVLADGWSASAGTVRPGEPTDIEVEVVTPAGTQERSFPLYPIPPRSGSYSCLASLRRALWLELNLEPLEEPQLAMHVSTGPRFGMDFAENAAAAAFMVALLESESITFRSEALLPPGGVSTSMSLGDEKRRRELTLYRDVYGDLALIEKALDVHLDLPEQVSPRRSRCDRDGGRDPSHGCRDGNGQRASKRCARGRASSATRTRRGVDQKTAADVHPFRAAT